MTLEVIFLSLHGCAYMGMHTAHMPLHEHTHAHMYVYHNNYMWTLKGFCRNDSHLTFFPSFTFFAVASELLNIHQRKQTKKAKSKGSWILHQWYSWKPLVWFFERVKKEQLLENKIIFFPFKNILFGRELVLIIKKQINNKILQL